MKSSANPRRSAEADAQSSSLPSSTPPAQSAPSDPASRAAPLVVERIAVQRGRLSLLVRVAPGFPRMTGVRLAHRLLDERPSLRHHTCVNDKGPTFGAVIERTSLPHALEHLIIDEQVRDERSLTDITFMGTTEWIDKAVGRARVEVNFVDDLVALRAVRNALAAISAAVDPPAASEAPEADASAHRRDRPMRGNRDRRR